MAAFDVLNALNINGHTETKNVGDKELTYLSWPWAWAEVKKHYPDAQYTVWKDSNGRPYTYDPETGYMVYTSVTIEGVQHEMWLPVMDGANRAMKSAPYDYQVKNPKFKWATWNEAKHGYYDKYGKEQPEMFTKHCDAATMMDINKSIMRCLVKNLAMFGLGLYIYAGEDLPEVEQQEAPKCEQPKPQERKNVAVSVSATVPPTAPTNAEAPKAAPETGAGYLVRKIAEMQNEFTAEFNFAKARQELIANGEVENVASAVISLEQAKALVAKVYERFGHMRKVS